MNWNSDNTITVAEPKRPLKITATRFATILGLNPWSTPFEVWCEIMRTYKKPFEDTIYTIAGKTIEPKQAEYLRKNYLMEDIVSPTDMYGKDYFKKMRGDFFPDTKYFGGMWDYLRIKDGEIRVVVECKTTSRVEDWKDDVPEYYALQAALYAYLLGVDRVIMVASFLTDEDYAKPEDYECSVENTILVNFKVSERYPDFEKRYVVPAVKWWNAHVKTGISPQYDEKKDGEILKILRTNTVTPDTDLEDLVAEAEELKEKLDRQAAEMEEDGKRYNVLTDMIKEMLVANFRDGDKKVAFAGRNYSWEVSRTVTTKIDKKKMEADGILEQYSTAEESYRLSTKTI